jgi:hypothetical protein
MATEVLSWRGRFQKNNHGTEAGCACWKKDIAEMMTDPCLTDQEKAELLSQLKLPENEWEPVAIEGEPLSETIIRMRGER